MTRTEGEKVTEDSVIQNLLESSAGSEWNQAVTDALLHLLGYEAEPEETPVPASGKADEKTGNKDIKV